MHTRTHYTIIFAFLITILTLFALLRVEAQSLDSAEIVGVRVVGEPIGRPLHVIDYGSFKWAIYPKTTPLSGATSYETPLITESVGRSAGVDLYTLQFAGPTKAQWLEKVTAQGLQIVQYVHPFTYIVYGDGAALNRATANDFVLAQGVLANDVQTAVLDNQRADQPITVMAYSGGDVAAVADLLGMLVSDFAQLGNKWVATDVVISADIQQQLLALPAVYSLQTVAADGGSRSEMSSQANAGNIVNGTVVPGYLAWLAEVGVDGSGIVMANVDEGVDQNHPDLTNRFLPPCTGDSCVNVSSNHGTHTAGIMAGDGSSGKTDSGGFLRGLGVAPGAQLFEQDYRELFTQTGGMSQLMEESLANGALLSSNSWGPSGTPRGYDADTLEVDISARDADPDTVGNQEFRYVLAFMNGNGGFMSQGSPDEAKNIITVGSTKMRTGSGTQDNINDLSFNTAHGPARDQRTIPHIVAPGCRIDSTYPNSSHGLNCGTSMAAPQVAGALALFLQKYQMAHATLPSPALSKAALTVVADSLAGNNDADGITLGHPFDSKQGWGKLNLSSILSPTAETLYIDQTTLLTMTGATATFNVETIDESEPTRIMLAWTDAPGHGMGGTTPAWNNDLDLQVMVDGSTYLGNQFGADGYSIVGGSADFRNNTEAVFLAPTLPTGTPPTMTNRAVTAAITIVAANITSDSVPNNGEAFDQDFALACYNCVLTQTDPVVSVVKSVTPASVLPGELVTVTLTQTIDYVGDHAYTLTITDTAPIGTILTDTMRLNGASTSATYRDDRLIFGYNSTLMDNAVNVVSYQVVTDGDFGRIQTNIELPYEALTQIAGQSITSNGSKSYHVDGYKLFTPAIMREMVEE